MEIWSTGDGKRRNNEWYQTVRAEYISKDFIRHYLWFSVGREPVTNWWLHTWRRNQIIFITLRSPCSDRLAAFYLAKLNIKGSDTVCLAPCYASLLIYVAHFCSGLLKLSLSLSTQFVVLPAADYLQCHVFCGSASDLLSDPDISFCKSELGVGGSHTWLLTCCIDRSAVNILQLHSLTVNKQSPGFKEVFMIQAKLETFQPFFCLLQFATPYVSSFPVGTLHFFYVHPCFWQ